MLLVPPDAFRPSSVPRFLKDASFIFSIEGKQVPDFELFLKDLREISYIGKLLLVKFLIYTAQKKCFLYPSINYGGNEDIIEELEKSGFYSILAEHVTQDSRTDSIIQRLRAIRYVETDKMFVAPHILVRSRKESKTELEAKFAERIEKFYDCQKKMSIIIGCSSELIMNFWSHATEETSTIMLAIGTQERIEILIADNAVGITSHLKSNNPKYSNLPDATVLRSALDKGVTSRENGNHMGCGLYLISKLVEANGGEFTVYTGSLCLEQTGVKVKVAASPYWKGTIMRLVINLSNPRTIEESGSFTYNNSIQINWG